MIIAIIFLLLVTAQPVQAATFNRNHIISDDDMLDYKRMSLSGIQSFLTSEGGALSTYMAADLDGDTKSSAEIIYNAAVRYELNPQFIIATIQKESSLVTGHRTDLLDWALGYGVCDSCSKDHPNVIKYKGFAKQIDAAANKIRNSYLTDLADRNMTISGWGVGLNKTTLDGISITPTNRATAVLYTYTPWLGYYGGDSSVGGNSLFFDIMERFFPNRTSSTYYYPNSTLLQDASTGSVFKMEHNRLRPITSLTALLSNYNPNRIITVDSDVINRYDQGEPITFPKFILVQDPTGGISLIDGEHKRRAIPSKEIFKALGFNPEEVLPISAEELASIPQNPPLTESDKYPLGALVQESTGAVNYLDENKTIHPIWSKDILTNRFQGYAIYPEADSFIDGFTVGKPVKLLDGTLVKIPERDSIYVIDKGKKRLIPSPKQVEKLGGFGNVTTISKTILQLHPTGEDMSLKTKTKKTTDTKTTKAESDKKHKK